MTWPADFTRTTKLLVVISTLLTGVASPAKIYKVVAVERCQSILTEQPKSQFRISAGKYLSELKSSYGLRLFLRPSNPTGIRWGGLLEASKIENKGVLERLHYLIWKMPVVAAGIDKTGQYELSPVGLLNEQILNRPLRFASGKLGKELEASSLTTFVFDSLFLAAVYEFLSDQYDRHLDGSLNQQMEEQKSILKLMIDYDRRYFPIQAALSSGKMTADQAEKAAYVLSRILGDFYLGAYNPEIILQDEDLIGQPMFEDLAIFKTKGLQVGENFKKLPAFSSLVSPESLHQMIVNRVDLLLGYDLIVGLALGHPHPQAELRKDLQERIVRDPFFIELQRRLNKKQISKMELIQYAQENLYWASRLKEYSILGLQRLVEGTQQPVSLEIFQNEMRNELNSKLKNPKKGESQ